MGNRLPRKLADIQYADVTGYSRLAGDDEDATHGAPGEYLDLLSNTVMQSDYANTIHFAGKETNNEAESDPMKAVEATQ